jgi:predicted nucleotidyltransferase
VGPGPRLDPAAERRLSVSPARDKALAFARRAVVICHRELGGTVASIILHGSLAFDDYRPGRSDIDLLVVVERPLDDGETERLVSATTAGWAGAPGPLDLRVVTRAVAASPTEAPPMELYARLYPRAGPVVERRHPGERDLLVELSVCRAHGRSLAGASPAAAVGRVPRSWVLRAGDALLEGWQSLTDDAAHAELMALTACRVWRFCEEGVHCSKSAAGEWALARDHTLTAVRQALTQRNTDPTQPVDPAEIARLLATVRATLAASDP